MLLSKSHWAYCPAFVTIYNIKSSIVTCISTLSAKLLVYSIFIYCINWAIINGETKTGVTTFFIDDKIDTGATILSKEVAISSEENAGVLHDILMNLGSEAVVETLNLIENGNVNPKSQVDTDDIKTAYKLNRDNCKIDWNKPGKEIHNLIRGLSPYPAAWTYIADKGQEWNVKIYEALFTAESHSEALGKIFTTKKQMKIATRDGYIEIVQLQFPGKKNLKTFELLNGITFSEDANAI